MNFSWLPKRSLHEWLFGLPACLILLTILVNSNAGDLHSQMLKLGDHFWEGYFDLRVDVPEPSCNRNVVIEDELQRQIRLRADEPKDDVLDLFVDDPVDPEILRHSINSAKQACEQRFAHYETINQKITPEVRFYRAIELYIADQVAGGLESKGLVLALMFFICATATTLSRHHISMRPMVTRKDHRLSSAMQLSGHVLLLMSALAYQDLTFRTSNEITPIRETLHQFWVLGFSILALISLVQTVKVPASAKAGGSWLGAILSIPLYVMMCLITGGYLLLANHIAGLVIYLEKLVDLSDMFLGIGLYVWVGLMLRESRVAGLIFDLVRPWKLPPELFAFVVIIIAALPTAYTGASGVLVIAAGAVIYHEMIKAGARRQLALATTAMSGSMGVVLQPGLLVVAVAYLNREVTTDELFGWGIWVFFLTAALFFLVSFSVNRQSKLSIAPVREALPQSLAGLKKLIPYALVTALVLLAYHLLLDIQMDEFTAPKLLPAIMLALLFYERFLPKAKSNTKTTASVKRRFDFSGFEKGLRSATSTTVIEYGALLMVFGLSVGVGGVIERAGLVEMLPQAFDSPIIAMSIFVAVLVVLGMIMDPLGAIILVSATITHIAYKSGIDPLHFWMVALVAFELGYLSPPVALNHLLTRQVVGEKEVALSVIANGNWYQRHERVLMPLLIMGTALLVVAYVPFLFYL